MKSSDEDLLTDLGRLYSMLRRRFDRAMSEQGASLARTKMLIVIQSEGGTLRAADIADRFGITPRTVTEAVDGLEREGLVVRRPDPEDRRAKRLEITPAGEAAIAVTEPLRRRLVQEIFAVLGDREAEHLHQTVRKLLQCDLAA
ncbi:MarR family winged helix-turn-helix transcriptional regulator [Novosphingobium sp. BL-52-GroH]|uniref:MarR family winged helix-turn-helix transcriptional regulator n=1 Tax=Novosphingobium sp. BL-52-GroH TaxID=3349877 RepID=UPI00384FF5F9